MKKILTIILILSVGLGLLYIITKPIFTEKDKHLPPFDEKIVLKIKKYCHNTEATRKVFPQIIDTINEWPPEQKFMIFFLVFVHGYFDGGNWFDYISNICNSGNSEFFVWLREKTFNEEPEKSKRDVLLQLYQYDYLGDLDGKIWETI